MNTSLQLKAAFLLIIFSLNMFIGCACVVKISRWFNASHHKGSEMVCYEGSCDLCGANKKLNSKGRKGKCCNDHIIKFSKVDKSLPQSSPRLNAIFFSALISSFYNIDVLHSFKASAGTRHFVWNQPPSPIRDIRVAVQSFQI